MLMTLLHPWRFLHPDPPGTASGAAGGSNEGGEPPPAPQQEAEDTTGTPGPIPYDRFKGVLDERNTLKAQLEKLAKAAAEREAAELKEQGQYKELLEKSEAAAKATEQEMLRLRVAVEKGLVGDHADLVDRLQGETLEEILADAEKLLELVKPPGSPGVPPGSRSGRPAKLDLANMTPEQIRENRDKILKGASG